MINSCREFLVIYLMRDFQKMIVSLRFFGSYSHCPSFCNTFQSILVKDKGSHVMMISYLRMPFCIGYLSTDILWLHRLRSDYHYPIDSDLCCYGESASDLSYTEKGISVPRAF